MSDYKRRPEASGSLHMKGERAGERFKSGDELDSEAAEAEYAKQQGATGIAGAGKRSRPEYKTGLAAYKLERKKKRAGMTGGDAAAALGGK